MPKAWSLFSNNRGWADVALFVTALLLAPLVPVAPAAAATYESQVVRLTLRGDGSLEETLELRVRLEDSADLAEWSTYAVSLDEHRELSRFDAYILWADGRQGKVGRKAQDRVEASGSGILHDSTEYHVTELTGLSIGDRIQISHTVVERPYFPASLWPLLGDEPVESFELTVSGGGPHWRYRVDGPAEGLTVEERVGGVRITGSDLEPPDPHDLAPGGSGRWPVLRFAWGEARTWDDVGRWYRGLIAPLPDGGEASRSLARELEGDTGAAPRDQLETLTNFLRQKIRYVAVEVGIGGYRPSPPGEVIERKWGDCKDKSLLLVDLLRQRGIEAYPALVRFDSRSRIDTDFPSPSQFNHLITAVPISAVTPRSDDPVAGDYLFVDPTQTRGGVGWLHSGVQDQDALVVTATGGELVRTPQMPEKESYTLAFDLELTPEGNATGRAGLLMGGGVASAFVAAMEGAAPERVADHVLGIFQRLVPGVRISGVGWEGSDNETPTVRMAMAVEIDGLVSGRADRLSLRVPSWRSTPDPRELDEAEGPLVLSPSYSRTFWRFTLPDGWCPPEEANLSLANPVGWFRRTVGLLADGRLEIQHQSQLSQRWFEGEEIEDLRALTLADYRATRRRARFDCSAGAGPDASPSNPRR